MLAALVVLWWLSAGFASASGLSLIGRPTAHSAPTSAAGSDVAVVHHEQRRASEPGRGNLDGLAGGAPRAAGDPGATAIAAVTAQVRPSRATEAVDARAPPGKRSSA